MVPHLGWFIGPNHKSFQAKSLPDVKPHPARVRPVAMLDTVQEIAVYIHRFHNLDLFQQGWYQIKVTMRWEDGENKSFGIPARVVQYEAPNMCSEYLYGIWRIDDSDNSFSTQPFRIKYAKQDVYLCVMASFNLSLDRFEGPSSSAILLKFELMFAPKFENGADLQALLNPTAIHEFRIPPKALLGLHSYCPVHFDAFHAVLVDVSLHISLLKAASLPPSPKVSRDTQVDAAQSHSTVDQVSNVEMGYVMRLKALLIARDILIEDLRKFTQALDQAIDLTEFVSEKDDMKFLNSVLLANQVAADVEVSEQGKPQNGLEKSNSVLHLRSVEAFRSLSMSDLWNCYHMLGDQLLSLWNIFLKFHRANVTKMLECLSLAWARDRRAEWSIWMVYSKVEMPHHYINSGDESFHRIVHKRVSTLWKIVDAPPHNSAIRAELHRRSVSQMRINNRSVQDMHIFGDPSCIPIIFVQRVLNAPRRTSSDNSYLRHSEILQSRSLQTVPTSEAVGEQSAQQNSGHVLKIVVFVHGFQGHHLDLRLVRNQWLLIDPKVEFLMSEANEDRTSEDFTWMGKRLAEEVISFLKKKMDKVSRLGRLGDIKLSFVGHSIGNLIIRSALADSIMEPYLTYLYTYVSVSGPHLGYLFSSNSLFNSGMWVLKKLKNTQCIHQLTFTDEPDLRNTFIYKLCKQKTLEHFRHIILLSSPQDGYVPYHSARIESCQAASCDTSKRGKVFLEMLNNCLDQIRANPSQLRVFLRCDVNFDAAAYGKNLNAFIGRAAHIDFLESDIFARFLMWSYPELFR